MKPVHSKFHGNQRYRVTCSVSGKHLSSLPSRCCSKADNDGSADYPAVIWRFNSYAGQPTAAAAEMTLPSASFQALSGDWLSRNRRQRTRRYRWRSCASIVWFLYPLGRLADASGDFTDDAFSGCCWNSITPAARAARRVCGAFYRHRCSSGACQPGNAHRGCCCWLNSKSIPATQHPGAKYRACYCCCGAGNQEMKITSVAMLKTVLTRALKSGSWCSRGNPWRQNV